MSSSVIDVKKLSALAYLDVDEHQLNHDVEAIMVFVERLQTVDTTGIAPLFSPLELHQRLRADEVSEASCLAELALIAPDFADDLYQVPKVIDND